MSTVLGGGGGGLGANWGRQYIEKCLRQEGACTVAERTGLELFSVTRRKEKMHLCEKCSSRRGDRQVPILFDRVRGTECKFLKGLGRKKITFLR